MLGKPKYKRGDIVAFTLYDENNNEFLLTGKIYIVDAYGTFEQNEEPSYDIMVDNCPLTNNEPCLIKHCRETGIIAKI